MGGILQSNEILLLLVVLLLILGPTKLPALARGLGQALREFKKAAQGLYEEEIVKPPSQIRTSTSNVALSQDDDLLEIAKKLGIETEGKTREQIKQEVIARLSKQS